MKLFELTLKTDNYGQDTTWTLTDTSLTNTIIKASGGPYSNAHLYEVREFLPISSLGVPACYEFIIFDDNKDGICCNYGDGWYEIKYDGIIIKDKGGEFAGQERLLFGDCVMDSNETR